MTSVSQRSSSAARLSTTPDFEAGMSRLSLLQQIQEHAATVKQTAEKASQLGAEADLTIAAATYFEKRAFRMFEARKELESAAQEMRYKEQYLVTKFAKTKEIQEFADDGTHMPRPVNSRQLDSHPVSGESVLDFYHDDAPTNGIEDITGLQNHVSQLQTQLDTICLRHTESTHPGDRHMSELAKLRIVADNSKQYKRESVSLERRLQYEQNKSATLQHQVARLQGIVEGLRGHDGSRFEEDKEELQLIPTPKLFIKQRDTPGFFKQVRRLTKDDHPGRGSGDDRRLIGQDIEMQTFSDTSPCWPLGYEDVSEDLTAPKRTKSSYFPSSFIKRTQSRLGSTSSKRTSSSASRAPPTPPPKTENANLTLAIPRPLSLSYKLHQHSAPVKVSVGSAHEVEHSILSSHLRREIFSDPEKRDAVFDLAMSWQTKTHQAPKCLYLAYKGKAGLWSAKDRREGRPCKNCIQGDCWPEGVKRQCVRLGSNRTEIEILNPEPGDMERQEIYDRANAAQRTGASRCEVMSIESAILRLGKEKHMTFGLQLS